MMTSNLLSRLLPTNPTARSIYEDLRDRDEASESDVEERAGLALDEENLRFRDDELGDAGTFSGDESRITTESTAFLTTHRNRSEGRGPSKKEKADDGPSKWLPQSPRLLEEDGDDDVPESLLIEGNATREPRTPPKPRARQTKHPNRASAIPGPSGRDNRAHWEATQAQQALHPDHGNTTSGQPAGRSNPGVLMSSAKDKAMWRWANVQDLDNFMKGIYEYYLGAGIWSIVLERALNIM